MNNRRVRATVGSGLLSITLSAGMLASPAKAAPPVLTAAPVMAIAVSDGAEPSLRRPPCDPSCPRMAPKKWAAKKYRQDRMGNKRVFSAADVFARPQRARRIMRRQLAVDLRQRWGLRKNWPYSVDQGMRRISTFKSCIRAGRRYSPYTYGIGVCQPPRSDLDLSSRQVAQAGAMIACAAGPAYVIASGTSGTPLFVALVQGSGCGFGAWLANSG